MENNNAVIAGTIMKELEFYYEAYGEKFYSTEIGVCRTSGYMDIIPLTIPEVLIAGEIRTGDKVKVSGMFRSYNTRSNGKSRVLLRVFVDEINEYDGDYNDIVLDGYLCKLPNYRETPRGRNITDVLLATNRSCGKSDYLPCILWGRNALRASEFQVGTRIAVSGRIQSRVYQKKISETESEERVAYEISVYKVEVLEW